MPLSREEREARRERDRLWMQEAEARERANKVALLSEILQLRFPFMSIQDTAGLIYDGLRERHYFIGFMNTRPEGQDDDAA